MVIQSEPQSSCNFVQNENKRRVSWKENLPVKLRIHKSVPKQAKESIVQAITEWNLISTQNIFEISEWDVSGATPESDYGNSRPTLFWLTTWEKNRPTEQARTTVVWRESTIKDADIRINAKDFQYSLYGEEPSDLKVDLVSLLVHELGHVLGFSHTDSETSVMYPKLAKGKSRRGVLELNDLESYSCEYGKEIVKAQVLAQAIVAKEENLEKTYSESQEVSSTPAKELGEAKVIDAEKSKTKASASNLPEEG